MSGLPDVCCCWWTQSICWLACDSWACPATARAPHPTHTEHLPTPGGCLLPLWFVMSASHRRREALVFHVPGPRCSESCCPESPPGHQGDEVESGCWGQDVSEAPWPNRRVHQNSWFVVMRFDVAFPSAGAAAPPRGPGAGSRTSHAPGARIAFRQVIFITASEVSVSF